MFNNNWYNYLLTANKATGTGYPAGHASVTHYDGTTGTTAWYAYASYEFYGLQLALTTYNTRAINTPSLYFLSNGSTLFYGTSSASQTDCGVILGTGDTEPAAADYCLSGNIITTFTATTSISIAVTSGKLLITATYNITNTGVDSITIKEIGICTQSQANSKRILVARDLLATPVTIAPGDTGVVTYKIEIS